MRFSLVINHGVDTLSPILTPYYSRCEVIEGQECLVSALQSLGGTFQSAVPVDLFEDETIQLTREIKDFLTAEAKTDFTQQFNIPSTPTNDAIFQNYFDENSVLTGWNAFLKLDAQIYIHSIPIFDGCVELTGVEFKNGLPRQYNLIFYGQGKKAVANWGEKTLPMVDWSDYNHVANVSNVLDSWDGNLLSGKILYPLADWHIGLSYVKGLGISNNLYQGGIDVSDLRPSILLKEMITACFSDIGYTLSGSLLGKNYFDNLYVAPMSGAGAVQNTANEDAKINVSKSSFTLGTTFQNLPLVFDTVTSDPLSLYDLGTGEYTVPFTGEYTFQLDINVQSVTDIFNWLSLGSPSNAQQLSVHIPNAGGYTQNIVLKLTKGDKVKTQYATTSGFTLNSVSMQITKVPYGIVGTTLNMGVVMPEMKVTDFITSFLRTYNAVLIPTSDTNFELHNIDDYYELGATKEWTEYIDMTDIRHEKVPIPRSIKMSHLESEDLANVQYESLNNQTYGSITASPEVDFSADELNVKSPFGVFVPSLINQQNFQGQKIAETPFQYPVVLDGDMKPVKSDFYLFYYNGLVATPNDRFQFAGVSYTSYPMISSYQDFPTITSTNSVAFGVEATISGDAPASTIFTNFYQRYLSRVFSSKSRIVHFDAILPVGEWLQLEMNDTIAVSGNYYKIQSIEYDILNEKAHLVLMSYPDVELQSYTTTGNSTGWQDAQERPDGVTTLNGDAVGRGVTNSKDNVGGGTGVTILGQTSFGSSTMSYLKGAVDELLKNRSVIIATNDSFQIVAVDSENNFTPILINTSYTLGNTFPYTMGADNITINVAGTYKVTAELGIDHSHGHDVAASILLNGLITSGYVNMGTTDQATSISEIFEIGEGSEVAVGLACLDGHAANVDVNTIKVRIERL